jgi:hypothetical protein
LSRYSPHVQVNIPMLVLWDNKYHTLWYDTVNIGVCQDIVNVSILWINAKVNLTQWCSHIFMINAGPKDLAGFILAPVRLNWNIKYKKTLSMNNTVTSLHTEYYAQDWNRVCIPENIYIYSEEPLEVVLNMHKQLLYWTQFKGLI